MSSDWRVWLGAVLTLMAFSWAVKDNPAYNFCERLVIGLGAGHALVMGVDNIISAGIRPLLAGNPARLVPLALGVLVLSSLVPAWHRNRILPNVILVAIGTGMAVRSVMYSQFIRQIEATWVLPTSIDNVIILVGTVCTTAYFVFTFFVADKGPGSNTRRFVREVSIWVLMANFGAAFGTAVQARISTFAERLVFLFTEWITILR